jgi:hypothetical protein
MRNLYMWIQDVGRLCSSIYCNLYSEFGEEWRISDMKDKYG